jgi:hypothetical protein
MRAWSESLSPPGGVRWVEIAERDERKIVFLIEKTRGHSPQAT